MVREDNVKNPLTTRVRATKNANPIFMLRGVAKGSMKIPTKTGIPEIVYR